MAGNLPPQLTSFVGRAGEIDAVEALLGRARLVTLVGTGGAGKTRLAIEVAGRVADRFPDGVWLVDLAPLADPALVPRALAGALSVHEQPDRELLEGVVEHLRERTLLLLLDNCEHLADACAGAAEALLRGCPAVRVLATSREALDVPGEAAWPVPPLSAPEEAATPALDRLARYEAVRLFVERAAAAQPGFALSASNAGAVAEICRRLDGLPLAIELAAARTRALSPTEVLARLGDAFALLAPGRRALAGRHRTLRGVIDWSHELLPDRERVLFRRLAVFAGGWTLAAAEAVCAFDDGAAGAQLRPGEILDLLTRLVDRSLVVAGGAADVSRYRFLETLRQYAWERLGAADEAAVLRARHAEHVLRLVESAETGLTSHDHAGWLDRLEAEHDNVRAALRWSAESGQLGLGLRMAWVLWRFWWVRGYLGEGRARLGELLTLGQVAGRTRERARATVAAGQLALWQGDYEAARRLLREGLALARAPGAAGRDDRAAAYALTFLSREARDRGDGASARALGAEAVGLFRRLDDPWGLALALHFAGLATEPVDLAAAAALFEESAALFTGLGSRWDRAMPLRGLGMVAYRRGDHALARARFEQSAGLFRERGDAWSTAMLLHELGYTALRGGDPVGAAERFRESLDDWRRVGNRRGGALCLTGLAAVASSVGRQHEAARLFGAAEAACQQSGAVLEPTAREAYDDCVARVRAALGGAAFASAWADGRTRTLDEALAEALAIAPAPPRPAQPGRLTGREAAVAALVARGHSNRRIAELLVISERTAESHVEHIRNKLGFHSRAQVAGWAVEHGLTVSVPELGTSPDGEVAGRP
jgi:predicted ATPase/DNA-binding CsgD family transcriptional regulator